jgi:predicted O-linked N-acetylglucosamine transferase (SPINDLY family)
MGTSINSLLVEAVRLHKAGRLEEAATRYARVLHKEPGNFDAVRLLGILRSQQGKYDEGRSLLAKAIEINSNSAETHKNLGDTLAELVRYDEAIACYRRALQISPTLVEVHNNLGNVFTKVMRYDDAIASYRRALEIAPTLAVVHNNLGNAFFELLKYDEAIDCYRHALEISPNYAEAHRNLGNIFVELKRYDEAITSYRSALLITPDDVEAHNHLGMALLHLERYDDAHTAFSQAIRIQPSDAEAYNNVSYLLMSLKKYDEAMTYCRRALEISPSSGKASSQLAFSMQQTGTWAGLDAVERQILARIRTDSGYVAPFFFLGIGSTPEDQLRNSRQYLHENKLDAFPALWQGQKYAHDKIRIGYVSGELHAHPMGYLMVELFEIHDRTKFEVFAFSYGPDKPSPIRARLMNAFDRFLDVRQKNDSEIARQITRYEIDIAVDLTGYMPECRPGILSQRPAPIQANYLGFPGTMGAEFIDYIVVDPFVVPVDQQPFFSEKLVHLPNCYQVSDSTRNIAERTPSRIECGLPEHGFVFCCFNNGYKITSSFFDIWMRLLATVPASVLWLLSDTKSQEDNLRKAAEARGISPDRLVFAPKLATSEHLARHRLADLFLDTLPYNAQTTANDALWAGLPLLTCVGQTFSGRVAGSLLRTAGLSELVTYDVGSYEILARKLATEPALLQSIRAKLARTRLTTPLFQTDRFRRHIESAYIGMWKTWQRGEPPHAFAVEPTTASPDLEIQ